MILFLKVLYFVVLCTVRLRKSQRVLNVLFNTACLAFFHLQHRHLMLNVLVGEPQLPMKVNLAKPWATARSHQCTHLLIITSSHLLLLRHFHRIPKVNECFKCKSVGRGEHFSSIITPRSFRSFTQALKVRVDR